MGNTVIDRVKHTYHTGTTSVITDGGAANKETIPPQYEGAIRKNILGLNGTGASVYLESLTGRDGVNFPTAVTEIASTNPTESRIVRLTDTTYVVIDLIANTSLGAYAITIDGTTVTVGSLTAVSASDVDSTDLCRLSDTTFAVAYRDEAGDDYLAARIGTVSGTTITMGTEKELTAAALTEDELSICTPRNGVIAVTYADASDDLSSIAAAYTDTTISDPGTAVVVDTAAPTDNSCCRIENGILFVAWSDAGGSMYGRCATVSAAGAIGSYGTEKAIVAFIPTYINARYVEEDKVIIAYEDDANDPEAVICTIAAGVVTTITAGTAVNFLAGSVTDVGIDMIDNLQGIIKWDDGTKGQCVRVALVAGVADTTITADAVIDNFVETASVGAGKGGIACATNGKCVIIYEDADNDLGVKAGMYSENNIIDVRSATASIDYEFSVFPEWLEKATY